MKGHSKTTNCSLYAPFENRPEYIHSLPTQNQEKDHKLYGDEKYKKSVSFEAKGADEAAASRARKSKFWPREVHGGKIIIKRLLTYMHTVDSQS